jgi:hypothetical protein
MSNYVDYQLQQLRPLVGATITALARTAPGEDEFEPEYFGLVLTLPNGQQRTVLILSDPEGNGPGAVEIAD